MEKEIRAFNSSQAAGDKAICKFLSEEICRQLPEAECKIWQANPVWFLVRNPMVGYGKLKDCIRLLFWSGQSFDEPGLSTEGSFRAAVARTPTWIRADSRP